MTVREELTGRQQAFLDMLFSEECFGDYREAAKRAGYSEKTNASSLAKQLKEEIIERTEEYLALNAPKGAKTLVDTLDKPEKRGAQHAIKAAEGILDRIGIVKKQAIEHTLDAPTAFLFLPEKAKD